MTNCALLALTAPAQAQDGGSRIIVLPLRGPGGVVARNAIADRLEGSVSYVRKIGARGAQRPARTARMHKADAMITGRIRCPGRRCAVEVQIYRRTGQLMTKGTERASRAELGVVAGELSESLLSEVGLLDAPEASVGDDDEALDDFDEEDFEPIGDDDDEGDEGDDDDFDDDFDMDDFDEPERRPRATGDHDFDAIEVYFDTNLTAVRNLCVDLNPALENDLDCDIDNPTEDDRTYKVSPFANMGFRLNVFPGSFFQRREWWSHFGLYINYSHSLKVTSQRDYRREPDNPGDTPEPFTQEIGTVQQDLRLGLIYRLALPPDSPSGVQLRFMFGFGYYQFELDDQDYPTDAEVTLRYHESNPYLPSFTYSSLDIGLQLRIPIRDFIFPFTTLQYRATLSAGQAQRVFGDDTTIHGIDWELGVAIELGLGIRLLAGMELIWYQTLFAGEFSPENEEEARLWGASVVAGDTASDIVLRFNIGAGWSY